LREGIRSRVSKRIDSFFDLRVYQAACSLDHAIFVESKKFPREEMYSLTNQVRRSSRSIGANISEAWAKRRYPAHFVSKLTDADAELQETQHWIGRALAYAYVSSACHAEISERCEEVGSMLGAMMQRPEGFT
jgi:four helix bundle protein